MQPKDRLVCAFVAEQSLASFVAWPLHVTIIPWFRLGMGTPELVQSVETRLQGTPPFVVEVGDEAYFGHHQKLVNLIEVPSQVQHIEYVIRDFLHQKKAWLVDESTKVRLSYRPHVTAQGSTRLSAGDSFVCKSVCLIEQEGDHKENRATIHLEDVTTTP